MTQLNIIKNLPINLTILKDISLKLKNKGEESKPFYKQIVKEDKNGNSWRRKKERQQPKLRKHFVYGRARTRKRRRKKNDTFYFLRLIFL